MSASGHDKQPDKDRDGSAGYPQTRISLIMRLKGDSTNRDWEDFVTIYWPIVLHFARTKGITEHIAEDIFQGLMLKLRQFLGRFEHLGPYSFRKFLKKYVHNAVVDEFRKQGRIISVDSLAADSGESDQLMDLLARHAETGQQEEATYSLDCAWLSTVLEKAVIRTQSRLESPDKWIGFERYHLNGEDADQVARDLGIRKGTLFQQKSHILSMLLQEVKNQLAAYPDMIALPDWTSSHEKQIRKAIEAYLQFPKALRRTIMAPGKPSPRLTQLTRVLERVHSFPPPAPGDWLYDYLRNNWLELDPACEQIQVGRHDTCEFTFPSDHISSTHCLFQPEGNTWLLLDHRSTNGTWVNQRRITRHHLNPGDQIQLGDIHLLYLQEIKQESDLPSEQPTSP